MMRRAVPLLIFAAMVVVLGIGLTRDPREVPSPLIGKPAPAFEIALVDDPGRTLKREDMTGKVWLLNVWASWCVACRQEHALLVEFSRSGLVPIYGLDYKDSREDATAWLARFGNPYTASLFDHDGRVGIDYGVYGVPETFVIDKTGTIRYKVIGPISPEELRNKLIPLIRQLNA